MPDVLQQHISFSFVPTPFRDKTEWHRAGHSMFAKKEADHQNTGMRESACLFLYHCKVTHYTHKADVSK